MVYIPKIDIKKIEIPSTHSESVNSWIYDGIPNGFYVRGGYDIDGRPYYTDGENDSSWHVVVEKEDECDIPYRFSWTDDDDDFITRNQNPYEIPLTWDKDDIDEEDGNYEVLKNAKIIARFKADGR